MEVKDQVNARLSESEQLELNALILKLENLSGVPFKTFRDFVTSLPSMFNALQSNEPPKQVTLVEMLEPISPEITAYRHKHGLEGEEIIEVITHAVVKGATETAPITPEISENTLVLPMESEMFSLLKTINGNRNRELKKQDAPTEEIEITAIGLMFNDGTKYNQSGEFYTGY